MRQKIVALVVCYTALSVSPTSAEDCAIKQAADLAVQKQITLIDAAKVNPSEFFNGANSCISTDILKSMDLSKLIPDLSGLLTSASQDLVNNLINKAKEKVCSKLNEQLNDVIGKINSKLGDFESKIDSKLAGLLNGSITTISTPNVSGIGQYDLTGIGSEAFQGVDLPQPQSMNYSITGQSPTGQSTQSSVAAPATSSNSAPATQGGSSNLKLDNLFKQ